MAEKRFFHVESKFFELVKNAIEVNIIERGRKHRSIVSMGFAAAAWLRDSLLEVAKLSNNRNVFRSFREGNKVFVVQKQQNDRGSFVTVTVLGDSKGRGGVIIPAGGDSWGWRRLSEELAGLLNPKAAANHGDIHRQPPAGKSLVQGNFRNEFCSFKAAVTQGKNLPKIMPINSGEINAENEVILNLKVKMTRDQDGLWKASWAGLDDSSNGLHQNSKLGPTQELKSAPKPGPQPSQTHKVWKPVGPKPNQLATNSDSGAGSGSFRPATLTRGPELENSNRFSVFQIGESSGSGDPPEAETQCTEVPPQAEIPAPSGSGLVADGAIVPQVSVASGSRLVADGAIVSHVSVAPESEPIEVDRTWGSSSEWVLELRDGRRVSIPLSLIRQPVVSDPLPNVLTQAGKLIIPGVSVGVGSLIDDLSSLGDHECSGEEDEDDENISLIWEDSEVDGAENAVVCWDDDTGTLDVEPLAMSKPVETGLSEGTSVIQDHGGVVTPSDWVLGKSKRIGKVLGASYHGNEEQINRLLMEIDGRRPQPSREVGCVKITKDGRTGSRELKRLTCSINYDSDSATRRGKSRERVPVFSQ
jgi:hypothetical protein